MTGGGGMFCPKDRGGCGKLLEWDDGAFCKECMTKGLYERLKGWGIKEITAPWEELQNVKRKEKNRTG